MDMFYNLSMLVLVGCVLQIYTRKFGMPEYGEQPLQLMDAGFFVLGLVFAGIFDIAISPYIFALYRDWDLPTHRIQDFAMTLHPLVQVLAFSLLCDFLSYWSHRSMHSKYLWNFHALHHSPKSLNWLSGMRGTFLHYVFMMTPHLIAASLFLQSEERYVFWVLIVTNALIQNLTHSNIRLPFAKYLQFVFITPNLHFVHHHPNPVYTNSNYGFVFSFWDRVFGTFTEPDHVKSKGQLGLDYEINNLSLILGFKVGQNSNPELVEEATKKSA